MRSASLDDRTARARIRDAAIACFSQRGVRATTIRTIAAAADVSPGLVIHHFGSKDALRVACDQHVAALVREGKEKAMAQGLGLDPLAAMRMDPSGPPLLHYLARTLVDGSPHVAELVDEMVADAQAYMAQGVASGLLRPSEDPHAQAALLTVYSLGALVLREHLQRLIGVDIADAITEPEDVAGYVRTALEIFGSGVMTAEATDQMRAALDRRAESTIVEDP